MAKTNDFNNNGSADILWRDSSGDLALWNDPGTNQFSVQNVATVSVDWTVQETGDFNGDGSADILWRNASGQLALWDSTGGGSYTSIDLGFVGLDWHVVTVGDLDGGGRSDIVWRNDNGAVAVWQALPGGAFASISLGIVGLDWSIAATADFNGDGKAEILWRNVNGDTQLWNADPGTGTISYSTTQDLGVVDPLWRIQAAADFNGDGTADILWRYATGALALWEATPNGNGASFTVVGLPTVGLDWNIAEVADLNGDGKADILWRNIDGTVTLWSSDPGIGSVSFTAQNLAVVNAAWTIQAGSPDTAPPLSAPVTAAKPSYFNHDGYADVLWRDSIGDLVLWNNPGANQFSLQLVASVTVDWTIQETGDFNGDGSADILWRNANGEAALWDSTAGGSFTPIDLGLVGLDWHVVTVGDLDGDGRSDIVWRNDNGAIAVWQALPSGAFPFAVTSLGAVGLDWTIDATADFNGDGKAEILWRNVNGDLQLWNTTPGVGSISYSTTQDLGVVDPSWRIQAAADFNGDGAADILWRNANGALALWEAIPSGSGTSFISLNLGSVGLDWNIAEVADLNGDGKADILWRNLAGAVALWSSSPGTGPVSFTTQNLAFVNAVWTIQAGSPDTFPPLNGSAPLAANGAPPSTTPAVLNVRQNSGVTPIGIAAPTDARIAALQLSIFAGNLPSDGTVLLPDGVTPVASGQALTLAELTGLEFRPSPNAFDESGTFTYVVVNPGFFFTTGTATLGIGDDEMPPVTTPVSRTFGVNSGATAISIVPPSDPNFSSAQLTVTITGLPIDGTVTLSNGTPVTSGQALTVSQLTGLLFTPTPGLQLTSSALSYTVTDPAGLSTPGTATLGIGASSGGGIVTAPSVPQPSQSGDIVGLLLQNTGGITENAGFVTFGEVFAPGAVRPTDNLVARINGVDFAVQMDVKSTNTDGSVRQAVLSFQAPPIAAGGALAVMLAKGSASFAQTAPTVAQLLASGYDMNVNFTFHNSGGGNTTDSASAASALQNGTITGWLAGPGVNEFDVVTTVDGGKLKVEFDIRAYANGTTTTDVIFDNGWMFSSGKTDLNYDVSIGQNGNQLYTASGIDQYLYSTWHTQFGSAGAIAPNVQYDMAYLLAHAGLESYDPTLGINGAGIAGAFNGLNATNTGPMGTGEVEVFMPQTGGRPDIASQPGWTTEWLLTQDPAAFAVMMGDGNAAGGVPWHYTDENTGQAIDRATFPLFFIETDITDANSFTIPTNGWPSYGINGDPWRPDASHMPDFNYVPYLVTGSHYQLEQLQQQAAFAVASVQPYFDYYTGGVQVNPLNPGNALYAGVALGQERQVAWSLRQLAEAAYVTPDSDPMKSYFVSQLDLTMQGMVTNYITNNAYAQYGEIQGFLGGPGLMAPWQEGFIVTTLAEVAEMNIPTASADALTMMQYMTNFIAGLYTNGANGFSPLNGPSFFLFVNDPTTNAPYSTWAQLTAGNVANFNPNEGWGLVEANPTTFNQNALDTESGFSIIARAALADLITFTQSPKAIEAYANVTGQIAAVWSTNGGPAAEIASYQDHPEWSVMPKLPDGQLLQYGQIQVDTSGASNVALAAGAQDALLAVVGGGNATLTGGSGSTDILYAGSGATTLTAGTGNDYLYGGAGANIFNDNIGSNYLQGGTGANTFTFADAHSGHDTVANFHIGADVLNITANLNGNGITTPGQLIAGATVVNGNSVLHLSGNDDITMLGVANPSSLLSAIALV